MPTDLRSRKRQATRLAISNIATRLFLQRGFDQVTVDEIAQAAEVSRMTVFNYFARKEDMFFDRDEEGREMLRNALRQRDPQLAPLPALQQFTHRLLVEQHPLLEFSTASQAFMAVAGSETLQARARAIRDELAELVATALAEAVGRAGDDADSQLAAGMLLAIWTVALRQAHARFAETQSSKQAQTVFKARFDQGFAGLLAAMADTPYV